MPFAVKRLADTCYIVGVVLLALNFANTLDSGDVIQAYLTGAAREKLARADGLRTEIARLETTRERIAAHAITSDETATNAANVPNCLSRERQATDAKTALDKATRDRDLTREEMKAKDDIARARKALADLGPLPKDIDPTAAKLIRIMALVSPVTPHANETVSEWRKIGFALGVELLAFSGPMIVLALFGVSMTRKDTLPVVSQPSRHVSLVSPETPKAISPPAPKKAPAKTNGKRTPKTDTETGDVGEWLEARTFETPGQSLQCKLIAERVRAGLLSACHPKRDDGIAGENREWRGPLSPSPLSSVEKAVPNFLIRLMGRLGKWKRRFQEKPPHDPLLPYARRYTGAFSRQQRPHSFGRPRCPRRRSRVRQQYGDVCDVSIRGGSTQSMAFGVQTDCWPVFTRVPSRNHRERRL